VEASSEVRSLQIPARGRRRGIHLRAAGGACERGRRKQQLWPVGEEVTGRMGEALPPAGNGCSSCWAALAPA
jgi:hypothetical protein